jgi:hypothetical protein
MARLSFHVFLSCISFVLLPEQNRTEWALVEEIVCAVPNGGSHSKWSAFGNGE